MERDNLGHNNPPVEDNATATIRELVNGQGRIKLSNSVIKKLERKIDAEGEYIETVYNDTERVGLKLKVNKGGSKTFFYQWYDKTKKKLKADKRGRTYGAVDKQFIGQFPDWKIEAAREIVDKIKQGIKLGTDPRSTFEANKGIPSLEDVVGKWKKDVLHVSSAFREKTKKDFEARFRVWFYLKPIGRYGRANKLQNYVLSQRTPLNIKAKQIHLITHDDMVKYHKAIKDSGAPYQANRVLDDLKLIVKWAMKKPEWKITENFALLDWEKERHIELHRTDSHKPYTAPELRLIRKEVMKQAILREIKRGKLRKKFARNFPALMGILAAMYLGRRYRNEILNLKWSQIDTNEVYLPNTKNSKKPQTYKTNVYVRWVFKKLREFGQYKYLKEKKIRYHSQKGYAFPSMRDSRFPFVYDIDKTWKNILEKINLRKLPLYMLRHSWATNGLKASNNNINDIRTAGGWKTLRMVEVYAQQDEERNTKTSERVARFIATGK